MSKYVLATSVDWADEFEVNFFEILDEEQHRRYQYLCEKVKKLPGSHYFGSNEGFDDGFDYLGWTYQEISDEEAVIVQKYVKALCCEDIYEDTFSNLLRAFDFSMVRDVNKLKEKSPYPGKGYISYHKLMNLPYEEFVQVIDDAVQYPTDKYLDACEELDEDED